MLDDLHREVDEWIDVGYWVIGVGRGKGRGRASAVEVEACGANAGRFRDGKRVEWIGNFPSKEAALEAVRPRD
jgi:hypothetical protein